MVPFDGGSPRGGSGAGNNGGADGFGGSDGPGAIGWMEKASQASSCVPATATVLVKPRA